MTPTSDNAAHRAIGMVRAPRATLTSAIAHPRSIDLAILILVTSAVCSAGFLMTPTGRLAALDQQVRQLESFGSAVDDSTYDQLRRLVPLRPAISAGIILAGWPLMWAIGAFVLQRVGNQLGATRATFAEVFTVVVHASAILAVRELVATPINFARESLGGATSLSVLLPAFGESTFPARLLGAIDVFALWWVALVAMGLGILYHTRSLSIARWLFGAYAVSAGALALVQALRGGV